MDRQALGTAQVIRANSRDLPLADNSVDLVVTSPPYFALRSYQDGGEHYAGQIGDEPTPAEFVESLLTVTRECVRVLKPSGSLWVNLGDKYATGATPGPQSANTTMTGGSHKGVSNVTSRKVQDGVKAKSLIGIPWRYALRCIDDLGLILRAEVIWAKPNGLPESVTDRVRRSHEQWFHFTLSPRYYSAVDEIREAHETPGGMGWAGPNGRKVRSDSPIGHHTASTKGEGLSSMGGNPLGKLPGSVWTIPTEPLQVPDHLGIDHFAAFPTEWPRRIIQGWSPAGVCVECGEGRRPVSGPTPEWTAFRKANGMGSYVDHSSDDVLGKQRGSSAGHGVSGGKIAAFGPKVQITGEACACPEPTAPTAPGVVLDPFGGTGTTAMVAKALGRHGISVDMSADYCRLAEWRTNDPKQLAKAARKPFTASAEPMDGQLDLLEGIA